MLNTNGRAQYCDRQTRNPRDAEQAFEARNSQYLLLKAPLRRASRELSCFIALDKLFNQGLKKVIVSVPERSIASSFASTDAEDRGFFADWVIEDRNNLCTPGADPARLGVEAILEGPDTMLLCTHATLAVCARCDR